MRKVLQLVILFGQRSYITELAPRLKLSPVREEKIIIKTFGSDGGESNL